MSREGHLTRNRTAITILIYINSLRNYIELDKRVTHIFIFIFSFLDSKMVDSMLDNPSEYIELVKSKIELIRDIRTLEKRKRQMQEREIIDEEKKKEEETKISKTLAEDLDISSDSSDDDSEIDYNPPKKKEKKAIHQKTLMMS